MTEQNIEQEIEQELERFADTMAMLNVTLTDDEIEAKRAELIAAATGSSALVAVEGDDLGASVETWDQVGQLPADAVSVTDDFVKLDDKSKLINVPFFARKWWMTNGEMGEFAVVQCVTKTPIRTDSGETSKVIITDGSTGIYKQLREVTKRTGKNTSLLVRNGLRVSQYTADTEQGPKQAETYYLT